MKSLQQQAFSSVIWSAVERFSVQGGQIVIEIILARLLLPSDYGLIAILGVFIAIAQTFIDGGFSNALIQKANRTNTDYSTILYFNILIAVIAYLILFFTSPYIADFYKAEQLDIIAKIVGLNLIISSLSIVQRTKLMIELNFRKQAFLSAVSILVSGTISICLAFFGWGVWALVMQTLLYNTSITLLMWVTAKWKPLLCFSKESFHSMFSYGFRLLIASLLQTIYLNLYTIVIGKKFLSQQLGYYNRAYVLAQVPSYKLTEIITNAIFPIQCKIQNNDEKLRSSFIQYLRMACFIIFPLTILLLTLANPVVELVLTAKWLPMVPLLQILCVAFMWTPVMTINHNILKVKGRMDYFLKAEIIKKLVAVTILLFTISFGLKILCVGLIFYSFADIFIITRYSRKLINVTLREQLRQLSPILLLAISMGLFVYCVQSLFGMIFYKLLFGGILGITYYITFAYYFKFAELKILLSKIRKR